MNSDLKLAIGASLNAGKIIMKYYRDDYEIKEKGYHNPVTTADNEADSFLKSPETASCPDRSSPFLPSLKPNQRLSASLSHMLRSVTLRKV